MKTIRLGDTGDDVRTWQEILNRDPMPPGWTGTWPISADGVFGSKTDKATWAWQSARGLTADGVVGPTTWAEAGLASSPDPLPMSTGEIPFVPAKHFTRASRSKGQITAVTIHTMEAPEGAKTAENVAAWFAGPNAPQASAHYCVDSDSIVQSVRDEDIAWHAGPANDWSIGVEHGGYAKQSDAEWSDEYSTAMLERSAELVAGICVRWGIPVRRITADDLARGERRGIFGHVDVTRGLTGGKGHTDPGEHFPWERYLGRVQSHVDAIKASAEDMAPPEEPPPVGLVTTSDGFVEVEYNGETWLVQPLPAAFVSIGEAIERAKACGCELPSPGLCDAIWRAADIRISPAETIQSHNGTPEGMTDPRLYAAVQAAVERALDGRVPGRDVLLVAGAWKDVAMHDGKVGLYGWHVADPKAFAARLKQRIGASLPLYPTETPGGGFVIQQFFTGHALTWRDYSQSVRMVRRKVDQT